MTAQADKPGWGRVLGVLRSLAGAVVVGSLLELMGVPAGMLLGSAVGAALANHEWSPRLRSTSFPRPLRYVGLLLVGLVSGVVLTMDSLASTASVAVPVIAAYLGLVLVNLLVISLLMARYDVDPATAVLAVTPGGLAEVTSLAIDKGAQMDVVMTVHAVRLLTIVFVFLPVVLAVVGS
ncbi:MULTISPECIES: AbrB family transcriptional regulator [unclassified Nocardiopsis]|uniref:AbrB family transcriptional regulator n=1 Tax=unclassified Nocardiopsis TaxID=2649073 RepID=UPI0033D07006